MGILVKNRKYTNVKGTKPFKLWDVFLYGFIILIVFSLFLFFIILNPKTQAETFSIYHQTKLVATFGFDGQVKVNQDYIDNVTTTSNDDYIFIKVINKQNLNHYNVIKVDKRNKCVSISDSNCSTGRDCTHSPAIQGNGAIVCAPHSLKVISGSGDIRPPVSG